MSIYRFYVLLRPHTEEEYSKERKNCLLSMTTKMMPKAENKNDKMHAIATLVSEDLEDITNYLGGLKCWEGLNVPAARPCGEGIYELVRHGFAGPLHFIYELEIPTALGKFINVFYTISIL